MLLSGPGVSQAHSTTDSLRLTLLQVFKKNPKNNLPLNESVFEGVLSRVRPVVMAAIGLIPAAISSGIGSEISRPLIFYVFYRGTAKKPISGQKVLVAA